jgi:hypothetical protein
MMPEELDDTTAAQIGHALLRWLVDEDPAGVARFVPELDPSGVDDAKAARIGRTVIDLLERVAVV